MVKVSLWFICQLDSCNCSLKLAISSCTDDLVSKGIINFKIWHFPRVNPNTSCRHDKREWSGIAPPHDLHKHPLRTVTCYVSNSSRIALIYLSNYICNVCHLISLNVCRGTGSSQKLTKGKIAVFLKRTHLFPSNISQPQGCLENYDLENEDLRPRKRRPRKQRPRKRRPRKRRPRK